VSGFSAVRLALTRLAALGTLSHNTGEGGPSAKRWLGEGSAAAVAGLLMMCASGSVLAETIAEPMALLQGLDKITARVSNFDAPVGQAVRFGNLSIRVRACKKSPPEDPPESAAFLEIDAIRPGQDPVTEFSGWMFAQSPALASLEDPIYDVVVLDCKAASGSPAPGSSEGNIAR
jgi:hypothetical protein